MSSLGISFNGVNITRKELIMAVIASVIWYIGYLYIRRWLNPDTREKYMEYQHDAIYGALAVFFVLIARNVIGEFLVTNKLI